MKLDPEKIFVWTITIAFSAAVAICVIWFFGAMMKNIAITKEQKCERFTIMEYVNGIVPFECLTKAEEVQARIEK